MITVIGFDADDTLWDYEIIYHRARPKIAKILGDGFDLEQLFSQLDQAEIRNIPLYGYGIKSYALSLIETVARLTDQPITGGTLLELVELIRQMLSSELEINPYAGETLAKLSASYPLILITKGEPYEQENKVERSGLSGYFETVEIVSHKTTEAYRQILKRHGVAPENFLMVGNSLKSDILPVIALGGKAVHISHHQTWFHEQVDETETEAVEFGQLEHLGQLPGYIELSFDIG